MRPTSSFTPFRLASVTLSVLAALAMLQGCGGESKLSAEEHIERAKDMGAEGNLKGMVIQLKNAIQKSPDNPQARLLLGEAYLEFKQADSAIKELSQAQRLGVGKARIMPLMGEALIQNKEYQRLLDELQPTAEDTPRNRARIVQLRGDALLGLRKFAEGCALYEESIRIDPQWHKALIGSAGCEYAQGHKDTARAALTKATQVAPHAADSWLSLAKLERAENRPEEARKALENALKANNADLDALVEHASLMVALKDFTAAKKDAERIRSLYPKHFMGDYVLALIAFNEKQVEVARDQIARSLQASSNYLPGLLLSGAIEYALGNMGSAEKQLKRVLQSWPGHLYARRLLAAAQLNQGRPNDAARTLQPIDPDHSEDAGIRLLAGEIALVNKQYDVANRHFEKAAALLPDDAGIRTQLAKARLAQGDENAWDDLRAASAMDDNWQGADKTLIVDLIRKRQFDAALQSIATLEKKAPDSPQPWNLRGLVYLSQQNFPKARESFERALKLDPVHLPSAANLAELDLHENRPDAARARFESILKADKGNLNAMLSLAALAGRAGNHKEQLARLEQANKTAPTALRPLIGLSRFHERQRDLAKALVYVRQAIDAHPNDPLALTQLGRIQALSGDTLNALSTHKKLADMAPNSPDALLNLAISQITNKEAGAGRATLQKILKLDATHKRAQDVLVRLNLVERKFDAALQIARQLQAQHPQAPEGYEHEGDVYMLQGKPAQAIPPFEQAYARGKSSVHFVKLARALHFSGNTRRLDEQLKAWLAQNPRDLLVRAYAAEYFMKTGRTPQAIAHYEFLIQAQPARPDYLNNLATLYQRSNDRRAQATAERALKLAPDSPLTQDTLGWIQLEQGQIKAGLALLEKATKAAPREPSIRYHYAAGLARSGNPTQARKILRELLAASPDFAESEQARALLNSL